MRKVTIESKQLFVEPRVTVEHRNVEPFARVRISRNVELVLPFNEFQSWLGTLGLEVANAHVDVLAGHADQSSPFAEYVEQQGISA